MSLGHWGWCREERCRLGRLQWIEEVVKPGTDCWHAEIWTRVWARPFIWWWEVKMRYLLYEQIRYTSRQEGLSCVQ